MGIIYDIEVLDNGHASGRLSAEAGSIHRGRPHPPVLVLLDLNLPGLNGYQVLKILRSEERTKLIPVVVLTTTDDPEEVALCYRPGLQYVYCQSLWTRNCLPKPFSALALFFRL